MKSLRSSRLLSEGGFSQRPARKRAARPRSQTPFLKFSFNGKRISAVAGVSFYELWFALHEGTAPAPQAIEFVEQLRARSGRKRLPLGKGRCAHGGRAARAFTQGLGEAVGVERLAAHAPGLNPGGVSLRAPQNHDLGNVTPDALWKPSKAARNAWFKAHKRPFVIRASGCKSSYPSHRLGFNKGGCRRIRAR